ncbi:hypothetical protein N869_13320 [Cellulomonas bogoriensis 69B4 = DSM 16987]|uniref:Histidine kinase n=1 Tax=Cellulomonas bogoriensis 69B4 = DSM 16987 TaxID=1386082 RepID=A0A0A0C016_9CELL|nr:hypothetical protein N869_13320 [Cellulomonas bogoriensis 69B4 = DSM 16987]
MGSALSREGDPTTAGREAAQEAVRHLQGETPGLVLVFASIRYDLPALLAGIREVTGDAPLVGATSSGQLSDGEFLAPGEGVALMVLGGEPYQFRTHVVRGLHEDANQCGRELARAVLPSPGERAPHGAVMLLADSLAGDLPGLLAGIHHVAGAAVPVVGGAAGADRSLDVTYVFHGDEVLNDGAVGVWIGSPRPLRVVYGHGWQSDGLPLLVTKVDGTAVHEIGGRPALDVYFEHFRSEDPLISHEGATAGYHSAHAFGLIEPDGSQLVRGAFIDGDGLLRTFSPLPPYCAVQIMSAGPEELLAVSDTVVNDALDGADDASVILTFSCVARMDLLADRSAEEAELLHRAAAPVSTFGFYTYGEFARTTSVSGYHNATITALAL